jgi:hypothetical protein
LTQIHGTPASVQDRSPQDFFDIMRRQANVSQRAIAEPRQFISFVMCLYIATDKARHQPNS